MKNNITTSQQPTKKGEYDTYMSLDEVIRQQCKENLKSLLSALWFALKVIIFDAFIYYGVWILIGLYIQSR